MRVWPRGVLGALLLTAPALAQAPGETVWGEQGYVEYVVGSGPILLSAPHGGDLQPPSVADRTYGVTTQDRRTQETARELAAAIAAATGVRPHLVISHLHRRKLDPNREIVEAAQGDPFAEQAWQDFHGFCAQARAGIEVAWGRGLYVDVHGHGHPEAWVELGYALTADQLALPDPTLDQPLYRDASTLRSLASAPGVSFPEILRGATSLGGFLQAVGIDAVPSPANPDPAGGNYFTGGFNVRRYGSRDGGTVDGVQIELPFPIREHRHTRQPFVTRTADWVSTFLATYYAIQPENDPQVTVAAADGVASETGGAGAFSIHRTGSTEAARVVAYALAGSADPGTDYRDPGVLAFFPPGVADVAVPVTPVDDALAEGDETVQLTLVGGTEIGAANRATVLLLDDELGEDPAAWLALDEAAGSTADDSSGNGHAGTLSGGPGRIPGITGPGALHFDEVDDHLRIPDFSYAPGGVGTVSFWFRTVPSGGSAYQYVLSHGAFGVPNSLNVYFNEQTGLLRTALVFANDLTDTDVLDVAEDLRDGLWHHYALVFRRDGLSRVFVDGAEQATAYFGGDGFDPAGDLFAGGRSDLNGTRFYGGDLDDLRIHDRALSEVEVRALSAGLGPDAAVHPGTGEDLVLASGVDAPPGAGPRLDVKTAHNGQLLSVHFGSPAGTADGALVVLAAELFPTGSPPETGLPELHVSPSAVIVVPPLALTPDGVTWEIAVPPSGFSGTSLIVQAAALLPAASNGVFAATDAHEFRIE